MPYATQIDMEDRFGADELVQLTDRTPPASAIDVDVLTRALTDADGVINRYLGARFAVPLAPAYPADIVRTACDIARYLLHDLGAPEAVRQHYEDAVSWLRAVADGKLPLVAGDGSIVAPKSAAVGPSAVRGYADSATFGSAFAAAWKAP